MEKGNRQGRALRRARTVTLLAVFVAVIVSLAFDSGLGTPSSFGIGEFFLLCPLGGLEAFLASKAFLPVTAISLAVVLVLALLFGRGWCAWGCPVPPIRRFFKREPKFAGIGSGARPQRRGGRPHPFRLRGRARAGAKPLARPCVSYRPRPAYLDASGRAGRRLHRRLPAVLPGVPHRAHLRLRWGRCGTSSWTSR